MCETKGAVSTVVMLLLVVVALLAAQAKALLTITNFTAPTAATPRLGLWEATFALAGAGYTNPFNATQIVVVARFAHAASGTKLDREAFWMQQYRRTSTSPPEVLVAGSWTWAVRSAPTLPGVWSVSLSAKDAVSGGASFGPVSFTCVESASKGFVRVSPRDGRFLEFSDGSAFVPIGENLGWAGSGRTHDIDLWLDHLHRGATFVRYWMCSWWHTIEWKAPGAVLGDYTLWQQSMWHLDHDIEAARLRDIVVMLCILNHGAVSSRTNPEWENNPYNAANGGMCRTTQDFFRHPQARQLFAQRLRYIVARVGYAPNIIWELANEIDYTDNFNTDPSVRADVVAWHTEMASVLRHHDSSMHLVTTSTSGEYCPALVNSTFDLVQFHDYSYAKNRDLTFRKRVKQGRDLLPNHPVFVGEAGICGSGDETARLDPTGIELHNRLWGALLSGSAGGACPWWWDSNTEPLNLYYHFRAATRFMAGRDVPGEGYAVQHLVFGTDRTAVFSPTHPFGTCLYNLFQVDIDENEIDPPPDKVPSYLYGTKWNVKYRNPPTFVAKWAAAGSFSLTITSIGQDPTINITMDGVCVLHKNATQGATYSIPVAAGIHKITLDNRGVDWLQIASLVFQSGSGVGPFSNVDGSALVGRRSALAWVRNLRYNYLDVKGGVIPPIVGAPLVLSGVAPSSNFVVTWFNTTDGLPLDSQKTTTTSSGVLEITVPTFVWDIAMAAELLPT